MQIGKHICSAFWRFSLSWFLMLFVVFPLMGKLLTILPRLGIAENEIPFQFLTYKRKASAEVLFYYFIVLISRLPAAGLAKRSTRLYLSSSTLTVIPLFQAKSCCCPSPCASPSLSAPSPNPEEQQYLDLVRRVIETGVEKKDRTGVGRVRSLLGFVRLAC